jgi:hypothetical protein
MEIVSVKAEVIKGFVTVAMRQILLPFNIRLTDNGLVYKTGALPENVSILVTADYKKALKFVGLEEFSDSFKANSKMAVDNLYLFDKVHESPKFNKYMFNAGNAIALKKENVFLNQETAELFVKFLNYTNLKYKVGSPQYNYTYPRENLLQLKTIEHDFNIKNLYERYKTIVSENKKRTLLRVPSILTVDIVRELVPEVKDLHESTIKFLIAKFMDYANREYGVADALVDYDNVADLTFDLAYYYKNKFMLVS